MLIGHQELFQGLLKEAQEGRLHHAQIFIGPEHVGKTRTALELAIAMQGGNENPVLRQHILNGIHPDTLLYLDNGEFLSVEVVRDLVTRVQQSHQAPYLIVVLENLHRLRLEAANTLLKTLEEPPAGTVFFLTAPNEDAVLPTLRSRARCTFFRTVDNELLKRACDGHVATDLLVNFAMGRPGKLRRLIDDPAYFKAHQEMQEALGLFFEHPSIVGALQMARTYEQSDYFKEWLDMLLHRARTFALSEKRPELLKGVDLTRLLEATEEAHGQLKNNVNKKLLIENLLLPLVP